MSEGDKTAAEIIEAHQELVGHIERSTSKISALSGITIVVAVLLSISYAYQLTLPLQGVTSVTVNLADPANEGLEVVVLVLALAWLYVGVRDLRFSSRVKKEIWGARSKEREIEKRVTG